MMLMGSLFAYWEKINKNKEIKNLILDIKKIEKTLK